MQEMQKQMALCRSGSVFVARDLCSIQNVRVEWVTVSRSIGHRFHFLAPGHATTFAVQPTAGFKTHTTSHNHFALTLSAALAAQAGLPDVFNHK